MPGKRDLTGYRFGNLTVIEKTEDRQDRYCMWRCRCDCGGEILVSTKKLKRGTVTNCGCIPKTTARNGSTAEDLSGKRFGYLTVLYRVENKNGRTRWMCQCDCGKRKAVTARDLKAGKTSSCGCRAYEHTHNMVNLAGRRFGRLTAVYATEKRDARGSVFWHCRCDCGNELDVTESGLMHGNYKSCGCLKREIQSNIRKQLHMVDGTCIEWLEKRKHRRDNRSGFRGVYQMKNGRYRVDIGFKGQRFYIGTFGKFSDAVNARKDAENTTHQGFLNAYYTWNRNASKDSGWAEDHPFVFEVEKQKGDFVIYTGKHAEKHIRRQRLPTVTE